MIWLNSQKDTRAKLTRWHLLLSEFSFDIEHCRGEENELADALPRSPNPDELSPGEPDIERMTLPKMGNLDKDIQDPIPTLNVINGSSLFEEIRTSQQEDPEVMEKITRWLTIQDQPLGRTEEQESFFQNHRLDERGFWYCPENQRVSLLLVPRVLRQRVIWDFHDALLSGHPGAAETLRDINQHFVWLEMARDIQRYVANCYLCLCCKPVKGRPPDNQRPRSARTAWETVAVDLIGPYPRTTRGNKYILVVTDVFTKWVEAFPIHQPTASSMTQLLEEQVFRRYGYPRRILSDNGGQFTGHTWSEASHRWDCELWTTPVYHPRANPTDTTNAHGISTFPKYYSDFVDVGMQLQVVHLATS